MRHRPLFIWPKPDPDMILWGLRMLMNCTAARYELNKGRMVPLAEYSRDQLRELRAKRGIAYDERSQGTLQLFRTRKMLDGTAKDIAILKKFGVPYELLDVEGCVRVEPALGLVRRRSRAACGCLATRPATASSSPMPWPRSAASRVSSSATGLGSTASLPRAAGSPASPPIRAR